MTRLRSARPRYELLAIIRPAIHLAALHADVVGTWTLTIRRDDRWHEFRRQEFPAAPLAWCVRGDLRHEARTSLAGTVTRASAPIKGHRRRTLEIGREVFSNQIARIACATVWNQFSERDDQRGLVGGDRFGPLFGEHQRPKQIADFVLAADFEEIETYPVDTRRAGLLDEFDTHNPNNWLFRGIYADLMPARMESKWTRGSGASCSSSRLARSLAACSAWLSCCTRFGEAG